MGLILTRRAGESIYIAEDTIIVKILDIDPRGQVSIDVDAPKDISVHRKEIYERIHNEGFKTKEELADERDMRGNR